MTAVKLPSGEGRQIIAALSAIINDIVRRGIVLAAVTSESNLDLALIKMEESGGVCESSLKRPGRSEFQARPSRRSIWSIWI